MAETANNSAPGTPGAVDSSGQTGAPVAPSVGGFSDAQIQEMAKSLVSSGQLSEQQAAAMYAQGLVDSGAMTPAQAAEHLAAAGVTPQAGTLDQRIDRVDGVSSASPLHPAVRKHLESQGLSPARDVSEYVFPADSDGFLTPEEAQADLLGRNWLMSAGFSAGNGSAIVSEIDRVGNAYSAMSEVDRAIWRSQQEQIARQILEEFGQSADERIKLAKLLVHEIDARYPGLKEFLEETGAGSSAMLIVKFVEQAEALARGRQA